MAEKAKPAGANGGHRILISNWKSHEKNTLRAFLTLILPSGIVLNGCKFHQKRAERWIELPSTQYKKHDGSTGYFRLIEFTTMDAYNWFQAAVLEAIDHQRSEAAR